MTKITFMKKLALVSFFVALTAGAFAQTVSFSLTTPPCNNNGLLRSNYTGLTSPLTITYTTYGSSGATFVHTGVTSLFDDIVGYSGGPISLTAVDATGASVSGFYAGAGPFAITTTVGNGICPVLDTATADATGGTAPYSYQWYNASTMGIIGTGPSITQPSGIYGVTVTDAAGCVYGSMVDNITAVLSTIPTFTVSVTPTTANCIDGTATAMISTGAVFPVSYMWSTGAATSSIIDLVTNFYDVTVTDAVGCTASGSAYVPQSIVITAPVTATAATCTAADGMISATGGGGVPPYSYIWSNGGTTQTQTNIPAGFYDVFVTDANGCIGFDNGGVGATTPIAFSYSTTPTMCNAPTGTATLSVFGGTPPYSVMWYTTPAQTGFSAITLGQGTYEFHITDGLGCEQTGNATIPAVDMISASFISTPSICTLSTGTMTAYPVGGVAPYHFLWSNGATTATMTGAPTGMYHVTITDTLGCKAKFDQYLPQNSSIGVGIVSTLPTCEFINDGSITAVPFGGTPPYFYSWTGGGSTPVIISLPPKIPYWVTVTDALGCSATTGTTLGYDTTNNCYCTIAGTVYNDANGNCLQDIDEPGVKNVQIHISGRGYTYTDSLGRYAYDVPSGTYTVTEILPPYGHLSVCQANNISVTSVGGIGCILPVDFANSIDTVNDIHVSTWDYTQPVPGQKYTQVTIVSNRGSAEEPSVIATYAHDNKFFAPLSFVPNVYFHKGSFYTYNTIDSFPLLNPGNTQAFLTNFNVPTNIPIATNVTFNDTVLSGVGSLAFDVTPSDNIRKFITTVGASAAANFTEVYPRGAGTPGIISTSDTVLEYMVHFQNTGNTMAENVRVVDTLDDNLDWTSLMPLYTSAPCHVTVDQSGTRKVATFMFNNIDLPTMGNEPITSNGLVTFSIKTRSGLAVGSQFKNRASVYYDYHTPERTNQTLNTLSSVPPIDNVNTTAAANNGSFSIFPNPATMTFNAVINSAVAGAANITITDVSGRTVFANTITVKKGAQTISMDANQFTSGMYFVTFNQDGKSQTQKLVVIKE